MTNKAKKFLRYSLAILPMVTLAFLYSKLPEQVPTHWNLDGTVTYSSKLNLWVIGMMGLGLNILLDVMPHIDPKKQNYKKFDKYYEAFGLVMTLFMGVMNGIMISESFNPGQIKVEKVTVMSMGLLFIFLGNILPKIKSNFYFGIKTAWTLSHPEVWQKTQRLGGWLMFGFGILSFMMSFFIQGKLLFTVFISGVMIVTALPTVMSYVWYKALEK